MNLDPLIEDRKRALTAAEEERRALPPPDEAARLKRRAAQVAVPFAAALSDPKSVPESPPVQFSPWSDYAENGPLSDALLDPEKAVLISPEDARGLSLITGAYEKSLPTTSFGRGDEALESNNISFRQAIGTATPEDMARKAQLRERAKLAPIPPSGFLSQLRETIGQQAPQLLGQAASAGAGALLAAPVGLAPLGALAGGAAYSLEKAIGQTFESLHDDAGLPLEVAQPLALLGGVLIGGVDVVSLGALGKFTGLAKVAAKFGGRTMSKEAFVKAAQAAAKDPRFIEITKAAMKAMASEGGTEVVQEWMDIAAVHFGAELAPEGQYVLPTFREGVERSVLAGTAGAVLGGAFGGAGRALTELAGKADRGVQSQAAVDRILEATDPKRLPLAERAPEVLHEVVAKSSEEGGIKTVSLPLDKLSALFQQYGKDEAWVARTMPAVARGMDEAARTGGPVVIPFADFVTYVRPIDGVTTLRQDMALNEGLSPREAQEVAKEVEAYRKMNVTQEALEAGVEGSEAQIRADVEAKLLAAKVSTPAAARHQANLVASAVTRLAGRLGLKPEEAWTFYRDEAGLNISGGKAARDVAGAVAAGDVALFQRLAQVTPEDVKVERMSQGVIRLTYPGTPLYLDLVPDEVDGELVLTGHLGPTRDEGARKGLKKTIGGQGISTALYLRALDWARQEGVGFASAEFYAQLDVTREMYPRLKELGLPFKESKHEDPDWRRSYVTAADLQAFNTTKSWEVARFRSQKVLDAITDDDITAALGPLAMLAQKIRDDVRGFIQFGPERKLFKITLTGEANLSTFVHETGHYILELYRKFAPQSPSLAEDLRLLEEWAGVKPGEAWSVEALEKFARGFETYLGEGKAPSSKLATAFANFKAWILHVYRALINLNAPLTDEVRGVMDRMLATEEEIQARRTELGLFPSQIVNDLMTPEQQAAYRMQYAQGAAQAQAALDREAIAALRVEKTAEYKALKERISAEVAAEPVYRLRALFAGEGGTIDPNLVGKKLDRQAVEDLKLRRAVMNRMDPFTAPTGGIDPMELLPYFNFASPTAMLEALTMAPSEKAEVQRRVKAGMQAKYPDYGMRADWVEYTALSKLHTTDALSNAIEMELRTIHRKAGLQPPVSPATVAARAAKANVLDIPRGELRPTVYRDAESRALREQMKALAAGDFKLAADWTRKRLMARAMWQEAQAAVQASDEALTYVKGFLDRNRQARLGKADPRFRDAVKSLLAEVGLADPEGEPHYTAMLESLEESGYAVAVPDYIMEGALPTEWKRLTYAQVLDVRNAFKNIAHLAAEAQAATVSGRRMQLEEAAATGKATLAATGILDRLGEKGYETSRLRKTRVEIEKIETLLIDMDGGQPGFWHKLLFRSSESAQFDLDARRRKRIEEILALNAKYRPADWNRVAGRKVEFVDGLQYTHEQLLAVILNLGTELNRFKLFAGQLARGRKGWDEAAVIQRLHEVFPDTGEKSVWRWAQALLDYVNDQKLWEEMSSTAEKITGLLPQKQPSLSIPLPDGTTIKGGYYPLVRDTRAGPMPGESAEAQQKALDAMRGSFDYKNIFVSHGFTNERTGKVYPLLLDTNVLTSHLYEVDHFIANAPSVLERHRILNDPAIRDLVARSVGLERWHNLVDWNTNIARDGQMVTRARLQLDSAVNRLLWGNAIVTMGGNLLSGVNQVVTGVPATLAYLGPRGVPAFARAFIDFVRNPFQVWKDTAEASGELKAATFYVDRDLRLIVDEGMKGSTWQHLRSQIANASMTPVVFFQKMVNVVTWRAAFAIAQKEGLTYEDSVARANSVVRQSQSAAGPKDMTAVQRSHDSLARVLTALASYTFALNDQVMPRQLTQKQLVASTSRLLMLILTGAMSKALFDLLFPLLEEEDKKRRKGAAKALDQYDETGILRTMFEATMDGPVANVPIVGRPAAALLSGRQPRFGMSGVESIVKTLVAAPDLLEGKMSKQDAKAVVDAIGTLTGTPTRNVIFAPGEFIWEFLDGNVEESIWPVVQEATLVRAGQKGGSK